MRVFNTFVLFISLVLPLLSACASTPDPAAAKREKLLRDVSPERFHQEALRRPVQFASPNQVAGWLKEGSAILVDVRSKDDYQRQHLRGAINIPTTDLTDEILAKHLPDKSARVVIYCEDTLYPVRRIALTTLAHPTLQQLGYDNLFQLQTLYTAKECRDPTGRANFTDACPGVLEMVEDHTSNAP